MGELIAKQCTFASMIGNLFVWLTSQGYTYRLGDALRSTDKLKVPTGSDGFDDDLEYSYQELLFYNKKSKLTHGKHNDRLALDLIIHKDGKQLIDTEYRPIGEKWEIMGGRWGGRFGVQKEEYATKIGWDAGHFELD
jgi:hypothetical protein